MKKQTIVAFASLLLLFFGSVRVIVAASEQNYCQIPPFMSSVVPPNIFFTIDESTSMGWGSLWV